MVGSTSALKVFDAGGSRGRGRPALCLKEQMESGLGSLIISNWWQRAKRRNVTGNDVSFEYFPLNFLKLCSQMFFFKTVENMSTVFAKNPLS